ncbi:hypothetical protein SLA2020_461320 [Shorea laevis]
MVRLIMLSIFLLLLLASEAATAQRVLFIPFCLVVDMYFPPYIAYLVDGNDDVPPECCRGINKLKKIAKKYEGNSQRLCFCIEFMEKSSQMDASTIRALPIICKTHLSFPISNSMNCSQ